MRFRSDDQRRACFANMNDFARRGGKSNLEMFTDEQGRLRVSSDTNADTSFLLSTDMEPSDTKKFIEELDEEALAGLKRVAVVRPKVMQEYDAEPGYYTSEDEKVPFGRLDTPKIIATAERRGRGGANFVPGVAKDIGRAAFQNMYETANKPDEEGVAVKSDLPEDLLEEEYLMQVYSDYNPPKEVLEKMEPFRQDLEDEVWRIRALQKLGHPSTMEARAWRMGKQPKVDVETFVEVPRRKYEKSGQYKKDAVIERIIEVPIEEPSTLEGFFNEVYKKREEVPKGESVADSLIDLQRRKTFERRKILETAGERYSDYVLDDVYEPTKAKYVKDESWVKDSDVGFKTMADLVLSGRAEVVTRLDDSYLDGLLDYTTGHYNPGYSVVRDRLLAEKDRRGINEFSKHYKVTEVPPGILKDYAGMNWHAAKAMGFNSYPIKKNEVLVDERLCPMHRKRVIKHEEYENDHMTKGMKYWPAHLGALKHEI
jgi:hypothetical protein